MCQYEDKFFVKKFKFKNFKLRIILNILKNLYLQIYIYIVSKYKKNRTKLFLF